METVLILHNKGLGPFVSRELEQFGFSSIERDDGCCTAQGSKEALLSYVYMTRFASSVSLLVSQQPFTTEEALESIDTTGLAAFAQDVWSVRVTHSEPSVSSQRVQQTVLPNYKKALGGKFSFKAHTVEFGVHVTKKHVYCAVRLTLHDLGHRDYRVFLGRNALKGASAMAALSLGGMTPESSVLDPLAQSGVVIIEAALFARNQSPRYFEKQKLLGGMLSAYKTVAEDVFARHDKERTSPPGQLQTFDVSFPRLRNAEKNARIADVHKIITFSRQTIDWMDLKADVGVIDVVATAPDVLPEKQDPLFCERAATVLKTDGRLVIVTRKKKRWVELSGFALDEEHTVFQGKEPWHILCFKKHK